MELSSQMPQRAGPVTRQFGLQTNDSTNANVTLQGEASALVALHKLPETVNFAQLRRDAPEQRQTVVITRADGGPLKPVISSVGPQIKTELREIVAGEKYELDVAIAPPWPNAPLQGAIVLSTGIEQVPLETIQVLANIAPRVQAVPSRFTFAAQPPTDLDLTVRLNWDGPPGKLVEAVSTDPDTSAKVTNVDGQQVIVLHVPAGYDPVRKMGYIVTVTTDDPTLPALRIPITVTNPVTTGTPGQAPTTQGVLVPRRAVAAPLPATTRPTDTRPGTSGQ